MTDVKGVSILITDDLYNKIEKYLEKIPGKFNGPEEIIEFILMTVFDERQEKTYSREIKQNQDKKKHDNFKKIDGEEEIKKQLKKLGYL